MTTIIATPNPSTGSIDLDITRTAKVTKVLRTNVNGTAEVRASVGQIPTGTGSGTLILTDYEAAHGLNSYNAYVTETITRTNQVLNPRPTSTVEWLPAYNTGSGTASYNVASPDNYVRITKDATTAATSLYANALVTTLPTGTVVSGSAWVRCSDAIQLTLRNGATPMSGQPKFDLEPDTWTYVAFEGFVTTTTSFRLCFSLPASFPGGATFDVKKAIWEADTAVAGEYFHGSMTDDADNNYSWTGASNASTSTVVSDIEMVTTSTTLDLDMPWLTVPVMPQYSEQVETITNYSAGRQTHSTVHQIIGRADPLVIMGKLGTRTGTLEIWTESLEDANRIVRVFDRGEAVLLKQQVAGMDIYLAATSLDIAPYSVAGPEDTRYRLAVSYQEVVRPFGDLAGALGWTFDVLATDYPSFDAATAAFATFDDLTLGDTK